MGMTIDKIIKKLLWFEDYNEDTYCGGDRIQDEYGDWYYKVNEDDFEAFRQAADTMRKYQQLQADYENRLKADMVAMLTDMLIDVEEIASREQWCDYANDNCISRYDVEDLFQQKINSLEEA